jgi:hypothetical protein
LTSSQQDLLEGSQLNLSAQDISVAFLPWFRTDREIVVGSQCFWPFRQLSMQKIRDSTIREELDSIFRCYVAPRPLPDAPGQLDPVTDVTIASNLNGQMNEGQDEATLLAARDALAFACMDANNNDNWPTSDNFALSILAYKPGMKSFGVPRWPAGQDFLRGMENR